PETPLPHPRAHGVGRGGGLLRVARGRIEGCHSAAKASHGQVSKGRRITQYPPIRPQRWEQGAQGVAHFHLPRRTFAYLHCRTWGSRWCSCAVLCSSWE